MVTAIKPSGSKRAGRLPDLDSRDIRARVDAILCRRPAVGLALGVVRDGRLAYFRAHGLADISTFTPIAEDTVFPVASITKTFTAIAVMQLWEQGRIDLDAPANEYLRAYRLLAARAGDRAATVQHLLTHTAGIPEVVDPLGVIRPDFGESVPAGQRLPSLAEFYGGGIRLVAEPGTRFSYGNHGFATLGQLVADVTGEPLDGLPARARVQAARDDGHGHDPDRARQVAACHRVRHPPPWAAARRRARHDHQPAPRRGTRPRPTWPATSRRSWVGAQTSTARCSDQPPCLPCSRLATGPIRGSRAWAWGSSGPTWADIRPSNTRASCRASTPRSSSRPMTASA